MLETGDRRFATGLTLIELLIVLAIVALVATAIPIAFNRALPAQHLRATAHEVAARLRLLHVQAVASGTSQWVRVRQPGSLQSSFPAIERSSMPWGIAIEIVAGGADAAGIVMYPDGSTSGGIVRLAKGSRVVEVSTSPLTGRVRVRQP